MPEKQNKTGSKEKKAKSYTVREYLTDLHKNGQMYAALVRSPYSSGRITNIDASMIPEEYTLYTAREIPGSNTIKTYQTVSQIFCTDEVHYKGEPVGILVGPDFKHTRKWAERVQITFDFSELNEVSEEIKKNYSHPYIQIKEKTESEEIKKLIGEMTGKNKNEKPVSEIENDEESEKTKELEEEIEKENEKTFTTENVTASRILKKGFFETEDTSDNEKTDEFFKTFDWDFEKSWNYRETSPYWTETSGAFCATESGIFTIYCPTQWPSQLEKCVSEVLNLPEEKIEIRKTLSQGKNSNGSWRSVILACQTAVASYLAGKPVKLLLSREEQKLYMKSGLETHIKIRTGIKDEKIKAIKAEIKVNSGYQNPFACEIADRLTIAFLNLYSPEHILIETKVLSSPLPPTSISADKLDSASYFAIESQIQYISRKTGILPDELKLKNIQNSDAVFTFKELKCSESINAIVKQSDFKRKYSTYNLNSAQNPDEMPHILFSLPRRGIGLTSGLDGAFFLGSNFENYQQKMALTLNIDGTLKITAPVPSHSITDIWKKIASEALAIEPDQIQINSDTENIIQSPFPEGFSSNISIMTNLLKKCCTEIQKKRFKVPLPIIAKKATSSTIKKVFDAKKFSGSPFYATAFGTSIMELELNPYTYKISIKGIWVAIDCGEIFSIKAAENTVRLAIKQELESLIEGEKLICDSTNIFFVQSQNPPCQLGALIHNLIPGCFAASLSQAIGYTISSIPCTEEEIYEYSLKAKEEIIKLQEERKAEEENRKAKLEEEQKKALEEQESSQKIEENDAEIESIKEEMEIPEIDSEGK